MLSCSRLRSVVATWRAEQGETARVGSSNRRTFHRLGGLPLFRACRIDWSRRHRHGSSDSASVGDRGNGLRPERLRRSNRRLDSVRGRIARRRFFLLLGAVELENGSDVDRGSTVRDRHAIRSGTAILFILAVAELSLDLNVSALFQSAGERRELAPG